MAKNNESVAIEYSITTLSSKRTAYLSLALLYNLLAISRISSGA